MSKLGLSNNNKEGIVVFEKTEDEIKADALVKKYYADSGLLKDNKKKGAYAEGKFDVFMYTDSSGEKQYLVRDQIKNTEDSVRFEFKDDGTPASCDGYELTMVVQNQNNLLHEGNCIIVSSDKKIKKYISKSSVKF